MQQMTEHEVLTRKILQKLCQNGSLAENGTIFEEKKIDSCAVEQLTLLGKLKLLDKRNKQKETNKTTKI